MRYKPTIGLEIHAELKTKTKMFCGSKNDPDEKHPNVNVCPICMGHPGTLPVANKEAIKHIIKAGLALGGNIPEYSQFDRKNYFYPDLPKGYQISQYKHPLAIGGSLLLPFSGITVRINHIHLEEDAGKLVHSDDGKSSLVDYNRAGVPLMEMVTEPDMHSATEAREFAEEFRRLLKTLNVSDADMEKGHLRLEANISLLPEAEHDKRVLEFKEDFGPKNLGTKTEVKNINSFRSLERAIAYEIERQSGILDEKGEVKQETRGWDDIKQKTFSQRLKEEADDYRYFPEPDLPPVYPHKMFPIDEMTHEIPELPHQKRERLSREYNLSGEVLIMAIDDADLMNFIERAVSEVFEWAPEENKENLRKLTINYLSSDLQGLVKEKLLSFGELLVTPENFAELIKMVYKNEISSRVAKDVLRIMVESGGDPSQIVKEKGLEQISDTGQLEKTVNDIIAGHPEAVADYKKGKGNAVQFLVGQAMRETKGSANPQVLRELIEKILNKLISG